jgi:hypothetical protein
MVYLTQKTCICSTENLCLSQSTYVNTQRFSYNYAVSNILQKDLIAIIFLDSARLYVDTPPRSVLYCPKMAMHPDTLSTV